MSSSNSMRQLEERHVASKVEHMVWCSKIDLLALSNVRGEVALHRLTWQKVWTLAPPVEGTTVKGMAWRPDGKILAVAYSTNHIWLIDVENKEMLHSTQYDGEITCVSWVQEREDQHENKSGHIHKGNTSKHQNTSKYFNEDNTANFLPKLPSLSRSFGSVNKNIDENMEDSKKIKDQTHLNILLVGLVTGKLYLSVFGLFPCGVVDVGNLLGSSFSSVVDADISENLSTLLIIVACGESNTQSKMEQTRELKLVILDTPVLANRACELHALALKHGHIISLLGYLSQTMHSITDAWENILLEMDSKLATYAAKVPEGSVSADFLDLLMFGVPSDELETFLLKDLTEKGLKKLGHTIELSYSNIQKLVLKHLHSVGHSLAYHLAELRGMARWEDRYQPLGLSEEIVETSLTASGAFLVKASEVLQVIDSSMKNYKAFFRWLYVVILRLTDERVPPEITKITQQDLSFIADFLLHFDGLVSEHTDTKGVGLKEGNIAAGSEVKNVGSVEGTSTNVGGSSRKLRFNLEMLGQYLLDQDLTMPSNTDKNPWHKFLEEFPQIANHLCIVPLYKNMSLVQQHKHMVKAIQDVFCQPNTAIGMLFTLAKVTDCVNMAKLGKLKLTHINIKGNRLLFAFLDTQPLAHGFFFLEVPLEPSLPPKCAYFYFNSLLKKGDGDGKLSEDTPSNLKVLDVQFYLPDILSVLLLEQIGENRTTVFVQFPTLALTNNAVSVALNCAPRVEACALLDSSALKSVDNMVASKFAVSGSRKVAVVLSESRRKVRLFEMEAEEEDDEDDGMETTMSTNKDGDASTLDTSNISDFNDD